MTGEDFKLSYPNSSLVSDTFIAQRRLGGIKSGESMRIKKEIRLANLPVNDCGCGCGNKALPGNTFIHGHNMRGKENPNLSKAMKQDNPMHHIPKEERVERSRKAGNAMWDKMRNDVQAYDRWFKKTRSKSASKGCYYKDVRMRSSYEVKFASLMDIFGIGWEYEKYRFIYKDTNFKSIYTPDFWLPKYEIYIEVKGYFSLEVIERLRHLRRNIPLLVVSKKFLFDLDNTEPSSDRNIIEGVTTKYENLKHVFLAMVSKTHERNLCSNKSIMI